jgi:hypothetical protein
MVGCGLAAALTAAITVRALPLPVLFVLVFCAGLLAIPFDAARTALVRQLFDDDEQFTRAVTIRGAELAQLQVVGFAAGRSPGRRGRPPTRPRGPSLTLTSGGVMLQAPF